MIYDLLDDIITKGAFKNQAIDATKSGKPNRNHKEENDPKAWGRSMETDMKNLFKSQPDSLIDQGGFIIRIGQGADQNQPVRKGLQGNAREMLEYGLSKGGYGMANAIKGEDMGLKNTHGEQFHTDNDKMVEAHQSNVDVIDPDTEQDKKDRAGMPKRKESLVDASLKSLTQEELFLKSFDMPPAKPSKKAPRMPKDPEQIKQEKEQMKDLGVEKALDSLIDMIPDQQDPRVLATIHENDDSIRQKRREPEFVRSEKMDLMKRAPKGVDPAKHERCVQQVKQQGHDVGSAHAICTTSLKRSELDELVDLIKGDCGTKKADMDFDSDGKMDAHEKHHAKMEKLVNIEEKEHAAVAKKGGPGSGKKHSAGGYQSFGQDKPMGLQGVPNRPKKYIDIKSQNPFVKSIGPGGMIMDFGASTGNPIADNFTAVLNQFAEPIQEQVAKDQSAAYERALNDYVEKGEFDFLEAQGHNHSGGVNHGWAEQMSKPIDQQVVEAYQRGDLGKGEENPLLRSIQKSQQASVQQPARAPTNQQPNIYKSNPTQPSVPQADMSIQSFVGGESLQANSPTDAAVMEMYNSMMKSQQALPGEFIADTKGISIVAGDPLPQELEQFKIAE